MAHWTPTCTGALSASISTHCLPLYSSITVLEGGMVASPGRGDDDDDYA